MHHLQEVETLGEGLLSQRGLLSIIIWLCVFISRCKKRGEWVSWSAIVYVCKSGAQRPKDRRPSTTAFPGSWALGITKVKKCAAR
jgi:hypothetical protein